jgi:hypothetical protein
MRWCRSHERQQKEEMFTPEQSRSSPCRHRRRHLADLAVGNRRGRMTLEEMRRNIRWPRLREPEELPIIDQKINEGVGCCAAPAAPCSLRRDTPESAGTLRSCASARHRNDIRWSVSFPRWPHERLPRSGHADLSEAFSRPRSSSYTPCPDPKLSNRTRSRTPPSAASPRSFRTRCSYSRWPSLRTSPDETRSVAATTRCSTRGRTGVRAGSRRSAAVNKMSGRPRPANEYTLRGVR